MNVELGEVQKQFAELIWETEPVGSGDLVKAAEERFGWKKSTTYTVLRKLCEKGIFQNVNGVVSAVMSREAFFGQQGEEFVEEAFRGSLPAFIAAFTSRKKLSDREIDEILQYFLDRIKEFKGIGVAYVKTPIPLDFNQQKAVEDRLLATTGYRKMEMHYDVEPALIGGMVIRIGDRVVDSSVQSKLNELEKQLMKIQLS